MEALIKLITTKSRLNKSENMVTQPTPEEFEVAILEALADMNSFPPKSAVTIESAMENPTIKMILVTGASIYIVNTIIAEWVSNGQGFAIADFEIIDRLDRYESYRDSLQDSFDKKLENAKKSGIFPRSKTTRSGNINTGSQSSSNSIYKRHGLLL